MMTMFRMPYMRVRILLIMLIVLVGVLLPFHDAPDGRACVSCVTCCVADARSDDGDADKRYDVEKFLIHVRKKDDAAIYAPVTRKVGKRESEKDDVPFGAGGSSSGTGQSSPPSAVYQGGPISRAVTARVDAAVSRFNPRSASERPTTQWWTRSGRRRRRRRRLSWIAEQMMLAPDDNNDELEEGQRQQKATNAATMMMTPPSSSTATSSSESSCPMLGFIHPAFGIETDDWVRLNEEMLRAVASQGVIVVVSQKLENDGLAPKKGYPLEWYLNIAEHMKEAIEVVASGGYPTSTGSSDWKLLCKPDPSRVILAGWSVGAALAAVVSASKANDDAFTIRAVVSIAPTIGVSRDDGGNGGKESLLASAANIKAPLIIISGTSDKLTDSESVEGLFRGTQGPVLDVSLRGGTHCFIYLPFAADCGSRLPPAKPPPPFLEQSAALLEILLATVRAHGHGGRGTANDGGRSAALSYLWGGGLEDVGSSRKGVGGLGMQLARVRRARHNTLTQVG